MAKPRKLSKEFFVAEPFVSANGLVKALELFRRKFASEFPILKGQTEGGREANTPVPLDKSHKNYLFYAKGGLTTRAKIARLAEQMVVLLGQLSVSTQKVKPVPAAPSNVTPIRGKKRKSA